LSDGRLATKTLNDHSRFLLKVLTVVSYDH